MPDKKFLESYPLYRSHPISGNVELEDLPMPTINMHCRTCESTQTFQMANVYWEGVTGDVATRPRRMPAAGEVCRLTYLCVGCADFHHYFMVRITNDSVTKVGQFPPWSIRIDKNLESLLGEHAELYKRGQISESQGFGVGAFAYYRQVVETVIDALLEQIGAIIPANESARYMAALEETKRTRVAKEKIELVKDLLPDSLRPDGLNPLAILHDVLSEGIHEGTDEECGVFAQEVRQVLVFLVSQVALVAKTKREFTRSMRRLLDRKSQRADLPTATPADTASVEDTED